MASLETAIDAVVGNREVLDMTLGTPSGNELVYTRTVIPNQSYLDYIFSTNVDMVMEFNNPTPFDQSPTSVAQFRTAIQSPAGSEIDRGVNTAPAFFSQVQIQPYPDLTGISGWNQQVTRDLTVDDFSGLRISNDVFASIDTGFTFGILLHPLTANTQAEGNAVIATATSNSDINARIMITPDLRIRYETGTSELPPYEQFAVSSQPIELNKSSYVVVRRTPGGTSSDRIDMFINGVRVERKVYIRPSLSSTNGLFTFGSSQPYLDGLQGRVSWHNRWLTDAEVKRLSVLARQ